jgi:hypothetical protein
MLCLVGSENYNANPEIRTRSGVRGAKKSKVLLHGNPTGPLDRSELAIRVHNGRYGCMYRHGHITRDKGIRGYLRE